MCSAGQGGGASRLFCISARRKRVGVVCQQQRLVEPARSSQRKRESRAFDFQFLSGTRPPMTAPAAERSACRPTVSDSPLRTPFGNPKKKKKTKKIFPSPHIRRLKYLRRRRRRNPLLWESGTFFKGTKEASRLSQSAIGMHTNGRVVSFRTHTQAAGQTRYSREEEEELGPVPLREPAFSSPPRFSFRSEDAGY